MKKTKNKNKKGGFKWKTFKKSRLPKKTLKKPNNLLKNSRVKKTNKNNTKNMDYFNMIKCIYNTIESKVPTESMRQFNNNKALPTLLKTLYVKRNNKLLNETYAKFIEVKDEYKRVLNAYNFAKYGKLKIENQLKKINCKQINLEQKIGEGEFGEVFLGSIQVDRINVKCAIKTNKV